MEDRKKLEQKVIENAMKDPEYRERLKNDPKGTLEETIGVKLPEGINFHINSETPNDVHITIPHISQELSKDELSGVSGGWSGSCGNQTIID